MTRPRKGNIRPISAIVASLPKMPEAVLVAEAVATTTGPRETRRPWTVRPHALRRIYKNSLGTDESGNTTLVVKFIFAGQASKVARMGVADWRRGIAHRARRHSIAGT